MSARKKFVDATDTNVFALAGLFGDAPPHRESVPNRIARVDAPHIRRCIDAGLAFVNGEHDTIELTEAGVERLAERKRFWDNAKKETTR